MKATSESFCQPAPAMSKLFPFLFAVFIALSSPETRAAQYNLVHPFAGAPNDGANPQDGSSLTTSGSMLFGVTSAGGANDNGALFSINPDSTGFTLLHSFNGSYFANPGGSQNDGALPYGTLLLVGDTLYGTTYYGGSNSLGAIYSVNTNDGTFQLLHSFSTINDGYYPYSSLILSGSTLYGLTSSGGINGNNGAVFSIGTDGGNYQVLFSFPTGSNPRGSLVLSGSTLYGMLNAQLGSIFQIDISGANFQVIHSFSGTTNDGAAPFGSLIVSGTTLYGMTSAGGANNVGTVFQISTDTNNPNFQLLHSFSSSDGYSPEGDLTLSGTTLHAA